MKPIVAIAGCGQCGKTTLVAKLVAELSRRGHVIGTLKHDVHGFAMDHEGKDTWRHKQAGARSVAIIGPGQVAVIRDTPDEEFSVDSAIELLGPVDLVIAEGFKRSPLPKIEVFSSVRNEGRLVCGDDPRLLAVAGDLPVDTKVPVFNWNDIVMIADFVEEQLLL
ncbi:MAG: molybdopterin-guanine dinucleotide biosynthesis protein [Firmicutes bacterium]|nr:molybdopterin-guanine dinucleotide biosynthesis protein [Bacillota bacterium]